MIAATATCAAAATEARAQDPEGGVIVIDQVQLGDVFASQTLNVEDASDQITLSQSAQGNTASGTVEDGGSLDLTSRQTMSGDAMTEVELNLASEASGVISIAAQSGGNRLEAGAYGADMTVDAVQNVDGAGVTAYAFVDAPTGRAYDGANVSATAQANTVAMGVSGGMAQGSIQQSSEALTQAGNISTIQYLPSPSHFTAQAVSNVMSSNGAVSGQDWDIAQRMTGARTQASTSVSSGNAWDIAAEARAAANQVTIYNQGGSVVAATDQSNTGYVQADTTLNAYDYGKAQAYAQGYGNTVTVGNNDRYVEIDNTQFNSGGVEVIAEYTGHNGYDAYVGATAAGNQVTAYACSDCEGYLTAENSQTNNADVSAVANTDITGAARAVVSSATAVGNSATFYVTRSGQ